MKLSLTSLCLAAVLSFGLTGCGGDDKESSTPPPPDTLAEVDGHFLTEEDFRYWWDRKKQATDTPETRAEILDDMIHRQTLLKRARAAGLHENREVVEAINSLLIASLNEAELQPALAALEVSEEEARAAYDEEKEIRYTEPAARQVALLWFDTRGQAPLAQRYEQRLAKVRSIFSDDSDTVPVAEGFGKISIANSEHRNTRFKGGNLGWLRPGTENDKVRAAATEIAASLTTPGELSEVVVRDEGVFLVRLIDQRKALTKSFEQVRPQIEQGLLAAKRQATRESYASRMTEGVAVTRHENRLEALTDLPLVEEQAIPTFGPSLSKISTQK